MEHLFIAINNSFFLEWIVKSSFIFLTALILQIIFRNKSASLKHFILSVSFLLVCFLPIAMVSLPNMNIPIYNPTNTNSQALTSEIQYYSVQTTITNTSEPFIQKSSLDRLKDIFIAKINSINPTAAATFIWLILFLFISVSLLRRIYSAHLLSESGKAISGHPWSTLISLFKKQKQLKREIILVENKKARIPMTWGFIKHRIILPENNRQWSVDQCRSALFHELSHIKREDFLIRIFSGFICAANWFNPLAWIVLNRLKKEQEMACDEMVLNSGIKASTYANNLLEIGRSLKVKTLQPATAAIGMASKSELKERLSTILMKKTVFEEITMKTKFALSFTCIFCLCILASFHPQAIAMSLDDEPVLSEQTETEKKEEKKEEEKKEEKKIKIVKCKKGDKESKKMMFVTVNSDVQTDGDKVYVTTKLDDDNQHQYVYVTKDDQDDKKSICKKIILKGDPKNLKEIKEFKDIKVDVQEDGTLILTDENGKTHTIKADKDGEYSFDDDGKNVKVFVKKLKKGEQEVTVDILSDLEGCADIKKMIVKKGDTVWFDDEGEKHTIALKGDNVWFSGDEDDKSVEIKNGKIIIKGKDGEEEEITLDIDVDIKDIDDNMVILKKMGIGSGEDHDVIFVDSDKDLNWTVKDHAHKKESLDKATKELEQSIKELESKLSKSQKKEDSVQKALKTAQNALKDIEKELAHQDKAHNMFIKSFDKHDGKIEKIIIETKDGHTEAHPDIIKIMDDESDGDKVIKLMDVKKTESISLQKESEIKKGDETHATVKMTITGNLDKDFKKKLEKALKKLKKDISDFASSRYDEKDEKIIITVESKSDITDGESLNNLFKTIEIFENSIVE